METGFTSFGYLPSFNVFAFKPWKQVPVNEYDGYNQLKQEIETVRAKVDSATVPETTEAVQAELVYLEELRDRVVNFSAWYKDQEQTLNNMVYWGPPKVCEPWHKLLFEREHQLYPHSGDPYYLPLVTSEEEMVNGYHLYQTGPFPMWSRQLFDQLVQMYKGEYEEPEDWPQGGDWTKEKLESVFSSEACTEWSKMDHHGEYYSGYWKYPEGTEERDNAFTLSRQQNLKELCKLPFANRLKWATVDMGCKNRMESVRYTNFVCVWVERKMKQMNLL